MGRGEEGKPETTLTSVTHVNGQVDGRGIVILTITAFSGLGYHDDLQTRAVFMEVLTKILQQVQSK